ncbi:hypothetical protein GWK47_047977 [Chionoecetes opilio]|uniref:Uncharacterized protein n=1 Tax=Chionoecetes opilio TaxID=41210 RepID=A0A8J5CG04_CHIOP|nr:hypothetical protein GWK47_047977 [Chionoecetes opilio]
MGQNRLSGLSIISINQEIGKQLSYDEVINDFASKKSQKAEILKTDHAILASRATRAGGVAAAPSSHPYAPPGPRPPPAVQDTTQTDTRRSSTSTRYIHNVHKQMHGAGGWRGPGGAGEPGPIAAASGGLRRLASLVVSAGPAAQEGHGAPLPTPRHTRPPVSKPREHKRGAAWGTWRRSGGQGRHSPQHTARPLAGRSARPHAVPRPITGGLKGGSAAQQAGHPGAVLCAGGSAACCDPSLNSCSEAMQQQQQQQ